MSDLTEYQELELNSFKIIGIPVRTIIQNG